MSARREIVNCPQCRMPTEIIAGLKLYACAACTEANQVSRAPAHRYPPEWSKEDIAAAKRTLYPR